MKLFVDSSGWTAVFNPRDKYHSRAAGALPTINAHGIYLLTTDYILDETITNLLSAVNHRAADRFAGWVLRQNSIAVIHIAEDLWADALDLFHQYDDKAFSFTDCTSFIVMRQFKLREAFTFDRHFDQMGFRLWPK